MNEGTIMAENMRPIISTMNTTNPAGGPFGSVDSIAIMNPIIKSINTLVKIA